MIVAAFVGLFFAENVVLCIPILHLKFCIDRRNADLSPYFHSLSEERSSPLKMSASWDPNVQNLGIDLKLDLKNLGGPWQLFMKNNTKLWSTFHGTVGWYGYRGYRAAWPWVSLCCCPPSSSSCRTFTSDTDWTSLEEECPKIVSEFQTSWYIFVLN